MVYLDQLVAPDAVIPVPPGLVPRVGCDGHLSDSPLGVWRYDECLADFTSACGAALAVDDVVVELIQQGTLAGGVTKARGRRNINLPGCRRESEQEAEKKTKEEATRYVHALQVETDKAAAKVSHPSRCRGRRVCPKRQFGFCGGCVLASRCLCYGLLYTLQFFFLRLRFDENLFVLSRHL
jgi:hypothetical protein